MRRFFGAQRDDSCGQIQYLTAKCTRLARDKALLDRDFLVSREREMKLRNNLHAATAQLILLEQTNMELRKNQEQLVSTLHQQQELVDMLQQRVVLLVEESYRDAELLQQIWSELLCLQRSDEKMQSVVEELHDEAQHRAVIAESLQEKLHDEAQLRATLAESLKAELHGEAQLRAILTESIQAELHDEAQLRATLAESLKAELHDEAQLRVALAESLHAELHDEAHQRATLTGSLQAELHDEDQLRAILTESLQVELHSKTAEVEQLRDTNRSLERELRDVRDAHQKEVGELQRENEGGVRKLQETVEQLECLCQQQRRWMCCVRRLKERLMKEREALLRQVSVLEEKLKRSPADRTQTLLRPLQATEKHSSSWDADELEAEDPNTTQDMVFHQAGSPLNRHHKTSLRTDARSLHSPSFSLPTICKPEDDY